MAGGLSRRRLLKAAIPAGALALGALGAARYYISSKRKPNVIVLVADSMRSDHLGRQIDGASITPYLDGLASKSVLFRNTYSGASWTKCAMASLFTGGFTPYHGVARGSGTLSSRCDTIAKMLKRHGYRTMGLVCNIWMAPETRIKGGRTADDYSYGFGQGFDDYHLVTPGEWGGAAESAWAPADVMTGKALKAVDGCREPYFLYVHYMDTHYPWVIMRPDSFTGRYSAPGEKNQWKVIRENREIILSANWAGATDDPPDSHVTEENRKRLVAAVNESVGYVDSEVGRLLEQLRGAGALDNSVVIFASDHGEEYWERGHIGHGQSLYNEVVRVPLVISAPDLGARIVTEPVSSVGIYETIKDLCGLRDDVQPVMAPSLAPYMEGRPPREPQRLYSQLDGNANGATLRKVVGADGREIIVRNQAGSEDRVEVYDLKRDSGERTSLTAAAAEDLMKTTKGITQECMAVAQELSIDRPVTSLAWQLAEEESTSGAKTGASSAQDQKMVDQMRALGYLH